MNWGRIHFAFGSGKQCIQSGNKIILIKIRENNIQSHHTTTLFGDRCTGLHTELHHSRCLPIVPLEHIGQWGTFWVFYMPHKVWLDQIIIVASCHACCPSRN
ncbi:hypothetical protein IEQ34_019371 [Dendrobium chrysotoxum]|uniref:Uncharacterized protein n=1 Tax=Dendrobium chrysotoxum TaxID=161865 RepID=A0AAV7G987_DENCH|nr:hypothetical protein IEQ34_019371 [Dendrobium chrysotoxum]